MTLRDRSGRSAAGCLMLLALLASAGACRDRQQPAGPAPSGDERPAAARPAPRPPASGDRSADAAFVAAYADAFDRILDRLEELAPGVEPVPDAEGVVPLETRLDALLDAIERRCAQPAETAPEDVEKLDELRTELSVLRSRLAESRRAAESERERRARLERELAEAKARAGAAEERAGQLSKIAGAFVIAAPQGKLRALVRADVLRRRLGLRSDYELTPRALPVGGTERTIRAVDPTARVIYLGPKVSGAKVVSSHRGYDELYSIERRDGQLAIVLRDPAAFWRIGRYLIVQVS